MPENQIRFECQACGKGYRVPSSFAGKRAKCKACGAAMKIPSGGAEKASREEANPLLAALQSRHEKPEGDSREGRQGSSLYELADEMKRESKRKCPSCDSLVAEGAAICTNCGYSFKSGKVETTKVLGALFTGVGGKNTGSSPRRSSRISGSTDVNLHYGHALRAGFDSSLFVYAFITGLVMTGMMFLFWGSIYGLAYVNFSGREVTVEGIERFEVFVQYYAIFFAILSAAYMQSRYFNVASSVYHSEPLSLGGWTLMNSLVNGIVLAIILLMPFILVFMISGGITIASNIMSQISSGTVDVEALNLDETASITLVLGLLVSTLWLAIALPPSVAVVGAERSLNPVVLMSFAGSNLHYILATTAITVVLSIVAMLIVGFAIIIMVFIAKAEAVALVIVFIFIIFAAGQMTFVWLFMFPIAVYAKLFKRYRLRQSLAA